MGGGGGKGGKKGKEGAWPYSFSLCAGPRGRAATASEWQRKEKKRKEECTHPLFPLSYLRPQKTCGGRKGEGKKEEKAAPAFSIHNS